MPIESDTNVEEIRQVQDGNGNNVPPANETEQQAIQTEQKETQNRLGNFASGIDGDATDDTTGSTLPPNPIPHGVAVTVQAKRSNGSTVAIGLTSTPTVTLAAGESIEYRVQDTSQITIVANTSGDGVNFTVEQ